MSETPIALEVVDLRVAPEHFYLRDPIGKLLSRLCGQKPLVMWVIAAAFSTGMNGLGALMIALSERASSAQVLEASLFWTLPSLLYADLVVVPMAAALYVWQPQAIIDMFRTLSENKVIKARDSQRSVDAFLTQSFVRPRPRRLWVHRLRWVLNWFPILFVVVLTWRTSMQPAPNNGARGRQLAPAINVCRSAGARLSRV